MKLILSSEVRKFLQDSILNEEDLIN